MRPYVRRGRLEVRYRARPSSRRAAANQGGMLPPPPPPLPPPPPPEPVGVLELPELVDPPELLVLPPDAAGTDWPAEVRGLFTGTVVTVPSGVISRMTLLPVSAT